MWLIGNGSLLLSTTALNVLFRDQIEGINNRTECEINQGEGIDYLFILLTLKR